jgi:hypothetical protein
VPTCEVCNEASGCAGSTNIIRIARLQTLRMSLIGGFVSFISVYLITSSNLTRREGRKESRRRKKIRLKNECMILVQLIPDCLVTSQISFL